MGGIIFPGSGCCGNETHLAFYERKEVLVESGYVSVVQQWWRLEAVAKEQGMCNKRVQTLGHDTVVNAVVQQLQHCRVSFRMAAAGFFQAHFEIHCSTQVWDK